MFNSVRMLLKHRKTQSDNGRTDQQTDIVNYSRVHATKNMNKQTSGTDRPTDQQSD